MKLEVTKSAAEIAIVLFARRWLLDGIAAAPTDLVSKVTLMARYSGRTRYIGSVDTRHVNRALPER